MQNIRKIVAALPTYMLDEKWGGGRGMAKWRKEYVSVIFVPFFSWKRFSHLPVNSGIDRNVVAQWSNELKQTIVGGGGGGWMGQGGS